MLYYQAARFPNDHLAGAVYEQAQALLKRTPCDLSAYRFLLDQISHVAVLGEQPSRALDEALSSLLASGEATPLPEDILMTLAHRREQIKGHSRWVEGHYRSGKPFFDPRKPNPS